MRDQDRQVPSWLLLFIDLALTELALILADLTRRNLPIGARIDPWTIYLTPKVALITAVVWAAVLIVLGTYDLRNRLDLETEIRTTMVSVTFALFTLAAGFYLLKVEDFSRLLFGYFYLFDLSLLLGLRVGLDRVACSLGRGDGVRRVLLVGGGRSREELAGRIRDWPGYTLVGFVEDGAEGLRVNQSGLPVLGVLSETSQIVERLGVDEVIIAPASTERGKIADLVLDLRGRPVRVRVVPDPLEAVAAAPRVREWAGIPLIDIHEPPIRGVNRVLKRCLDLVGALVGLIVFAPLMTVIAVLIKLDSPGPVLFVQERAGQYGNPFKMYKFRSMVADAEKRLSQVIDVDALEQPAFKLKDDPRVTRVGRWLRRTSLDELPQLFNVLKGEMSLVGPRPEEVQMVRRYTPWQSQRLLVKPGMTGSMQISGRGDLSLDERVKLELAYMQNYSILKDLEILAKTLPTVLSGKGAY
jgi:exopolysaccharide biosynthesis polyprenyl glycosylphosphotransferase